MECDEVKSVRFDLEVGTPQNGELEMSAPVGCGVRREGANFTELRLWSLPRFTFYLKRNKSKHGEHFIENLMTYTLFARKCMRDGVVSFENPVGSGQIKESLPGYIEILFRFPRDRVFLSLYPSSSAVCA